MADSRSTEFRPDHVANPFSLSPTVPVTAFACNHCGLLRFGLAEDDQARLNRLTTPGTFWRGVGRIIGRTFQRLPWRRTRRDQSIRPAPETE